MPDGEGRFQEFQHGLILSHNATGPHALHGEILERFNEQGGVDTLGYPITDINTSADGALSMHFQHGVIGYQPGLWSWVDYIEPQSDGDFRGEIIVSRNNSISTTPDNHTYSVEPVAPFITRTQLDEEDMDGYISALMLDHLPPTMSLYAYDRQNLGAGVRTSSHYLRVTGHETDALPSSVAVDIHEQSTDLDNSIASLQVVNHGTASLRYDPQDLGDLFQEAFDDLGGAFIGNPAYYTSVRLQPGRRQFNVGALVQYVYSGGPTGRRGATSIAVTMYAMTSVRVSIREDRHVKLQYVQGSKRILPVCHGTSSSVCWGAESEMVAAGGSVQDILTSVIENMEASLNQAIDEVSAVSNAAYPVALRRVNAVPDFLELVVADEASSPALLAWGAILNASNPAWQRLHMQRDAHVVTTGAVYDPGH